MDLTQWAHDGTF